MTAPRNELRAGLLVLVALVVLGGGLLVVAGSSGLFGGRRTVVAVFADARGVRRGDPVRFAGLEVGRVEGMRVRADGAPARIEVRLELPDDLEIPRDSRVRVLETLTGSRLVEILPGTGSPLGPDEELVRDVTAPGIPDLTGRLAGLAGKLGETLDGVKGFVSRAEGIAGSVAAAVEGDRLERMLERLDAASGDVATAARRLRTTIEEVGPVVADAASELRDTGRGASALVEEARPEVRAILGRVRVAADGAARLVEGDEAPIARTLARVEEAADDLRGLIRDYGEAGRTAGDLLAESRPRVAEILDRLRTTGTNLKAASEDLRAHPWKLLNAPDVEEQRVQLLFQAARNFNEGAEVLSTSVRDLRAALERRGAAAPEIVELLERIRSSFADYERAEARFWEALRDG